MKICVASVNTDGLNAPVSMQFGRCPYFTVVEVNENNEIVEIAVYSNPNSTLPRAAGISTAQMVADMGCDVIIVGGLGPKSFDVISMTPIKAYSASGITVKEAVELFLQGKLEPITAPSSGGGMGMGMGRGMGGGWRRGGF